MRQILIFERPFRLTIQETPIPTPADDEVLVTTLLSAISPGTEMLLYRGQMPSGMATDDTIAALAGELRYPLKYGYAAVGRVTACGRNVSDKWLDRLVFAFHPHETHFTVRPPALLPLPPGMAPETAVFLPNMETAVSFLMDGQPGIGEQVAVLGQGVVGLLTTMLLAQLPLAALIAMDDYALRRQRAAQLGAATLDPAQASVAEIRKALQGERPFAGADLVYELSGNPQALDTAIQVAGYNGRVVVGSWYGNKQASLDLGGHFHRSHLHLISSQVSHIAPRWQGRWTKPRRLHFAWQMLAQHRPESLITHRFPITHAAAAYAHVDQHADETIQVILTHDE